MRRSTAITLTICLATMATMASANETYVNRVKTSDKAAQVIVSDFWTSFWALFD